MIPRAFASALLGIVLVSGIGGASAPRLVLVHDAGGTVSAAPWIGRADLPEKRLAEAAEQALERLAASAPAPAIEDVVAFPVDAAPLVPDGPERLRVRGLSGVVFALGADAGSLAWLDVHGAALRRRGATGFLVSASSPEALRRMRAHAARHGLSLDPLPGAALAETFGASSYPFVAEPSP